MQFQCKQCGKLYRVDERKLTPEGVRVRCRGCGTVLLLRLRPAAAPPPDRIRVTPRSGDAPVPERTEPRDLRAETPPDPQPDAESPREPEEEVPAAAAGPGEGEPSLYRYCIHCGRRLESPPPTDAPPACGICRAEEAVEGGGAEAPAPAGGGWRKVVILLVLIAVLLAAAYLGYRAATTRGPLLAGTSNALSGRMSVLGGDYGLGTA